MSVKGAGEVDAGRTAGGGFLELLDRWGWGAIPNGPIPPIDARTIGQAREAALDAAKAAGREQELAGLHARIVRWFIDQYQRMGFAGAYFLGSLDTPVRRREQLQVLTDAATGYALWDVLPEATWGTLIARFDVYHGGALFNLTAEERASQDAPG